MNRVKEFMDNRIGDLFDRSASAVYRERLAYYGNRGMQCTDRQADLIRREAEQIVADKFPYNLLKRYFK